MFEGVVQLLGDHFELSGVFGMGLCSLVNAFHFLNMTNHWKPLHVVPNICVDLDSGREVEFGFCLLTNPSSSK